jgi:predicted protein tyrosine phosphatase
MPRICVCGLDEMPGMVEKLRPGRLISLLPTEDQPCTPAHVRASDHLRLLLDDIDEPWAGPTVPARTHIRQLVSFLRASPRTSMVIHCLAGVSRSPAAALIALALEAPGREVEAARRLRKAGPFVRPNRLMVELADVALRRRGALVAALEAMGKPDMSIDFRAFTLPRSL